METMTLEQVLDVTISGLSNIPVPAGLSQQIGVPISHAIDNLRQCIDAIRKANEAKEEPAVTESDI